MEWIKFSALINKSSLLNARFTYVKAKVSIPSLEIVCSIRSNRTMKKIHSYLLIVALCPLLLSSHVLAHEAEAFFEQQIKNVQNGNLLFQCFEGELSCEEQSKLFVDAYLEVYSAQNLFKTHFPKNEYQFETYNFNNLDISQFSLADQMRILDEWGYDLSKYFNYFSKERLLNLTKNERYIYCFSSQTDECKQLKEFNSLLNIQTATPNMIADLLKDNSAIGQGDRQSLFLLCRQDRSYPCLAVLKNKKGELLKAKYGGVWSMPMLAYSRKKKPYYKFDGHTPSGVYYTNGVMPKADRRFAYGKFRRLILNFVPARSNESLSRSYLPESSHDHNWWKEASVARDMGRAHFRIHGTGLGNHNKRSNYYSLVATRGCVASREGRYDDVTYKDQKKLLDILMFNQGLKYGYENQPSIRAMFYVLNIDNKTGPVTLQDLNDYF